MKRMVLWILLVAGALATLLFGAATVSLLREGNVGAAIFGLVIAALPAFVAGKSWLALRRATRPQRAPHYPPAPPLAPESGQPGGVPDVPSWSPPPPTQWAPPPVQPLPPVEQQPVATPPPATLPPLQAPAPQTAALTPAPPARTRPARPGGPPPRQRASSVGGQPGLYLSYASAGGRHRHEGVPFVAVDVETTGFAADAGDRVIEVAAVRMDAQGHVEDEWATLVNPDRDTGPVFVHHISNAAVADAPRFADIADELLRRLDGAVLIAHNASFDEGFLRAELARAGYHDLRAPALCSLWLSRRTLEAPNYRLGTLAGTYVGASVDAHSALGDARMISRLLPTMLARHRGGLSYGCPTYLHVVEGSTRPRLVTRASSLRKGEMGWMHALVDRLPLSGGDIGEEVAHRYIEALGAALEDGRITGVEAKQLAKIAGSAGLGGAQVRSLNERFLEGLREAAFADDTLTAEELRQLTAAADALGVCGYFDDLVAGPLSPGFVAAPAPVVGSQNDGDDDAPVTPVTVRQRRCGYCRQPGHYRTTCPELRA